MQYNVLPLTLIHILQVSQVQLLLWHHAKAQGAPGATRQVRLMIAQLMTSRRPAACRLQQGTAQHRPILTKRPRVPPALQAVTLTPALAWP